MLRLSNFLVSHRVIKVKSFKKFFSSQPETINGQISNVNNTVPVESNEVMSIEEFRKLHQINVVTGDNESYDPMLSFADAPFSDKIKMVFKTEGYTQPTPTQAQSWPIVLKKKDLVSIAKTGKTSIYLFTFVLCLSLI